MDPLSAICIAAVVVRFRPIILTSVTTFVGLIPLMTTFNPATYPFLPIAISLAWGVLFATVITLLVPCLVHNDRRRSDKCIRAVSRLLSIVTPDGAPLRKKTPPHQAGKRMTTGGPNNHRKIRLGELLTMGSVNGLGVTIGRRLKIIKQTKRGHNMAEAVFENPDLFDLTMSEEAQPLLDAVKKHIKENVDPITEEYHRLGEGRKERWGYGDGQLELLETAKQKAKDSGLWNFFLPDAETGEGLSNLDYAFIANELGKSPLASETLNCSAPDTGNMEVLERVGTPEQKEQWLKPLLNGEIRSAFAMTEPGLPSSDAKNICTEAVLDGDEWVINGEKYYISGAGDPRCKVMITMVKTSPDAPAHKQQSQILVPIDTKGEHSGGHGSIRSRRCSPWSHAHPLR